MDPVGLVLGEVALHEFALIPVAKTVPLTGGSVMAAVGASGLVIYSMCRKRVPFRERLPLWPIIKERPKTICRLAVGCIITTVGYALGIHWAGIGAMATMTSCGLLWSAVRKVRVLTRINLVHIALLVIAFVGVIILNKPWAMFENPREETFYGIVCGILGAWSYYNYIRCLFDDSVPDPTERLKILTVANAVSIPILPFAVWGANHLLGGGHAEFSPKVFGLGGISGVLSFAVPTILASVASKKIDDSVASRLYLLESPIANVVGLVGSSLGLLNEVHWPDVWNWVGMGIVVASMAVSLSIPPPDEKPSQDGHLGKDGEKGKSASPVGR
ncbi:hypothetical protein [Actinomadura sp. B10D3]|uniref:hypothetical protein n=1 Tax=Actinomadura sp. B10D3 TaxID=3153557 RepID=UPI00325E294B